MRFTIVPIVGVMLPRVRDVPGDKGPPSSRPENWRDVLIVITGLETTVYPFSHGACRIATQQFEHSFNRSDREQPPKETPGPIPIRTVRKATRQGTERGYGIQTSG